MNKVILTGNLCRDIEVRQTQSGKEVVLNSIAVSRDYKNANGEYESDFINIVVWGASAVYLSKYASKGDRAELVGRWQVRRYEDSNGMQQTVNECVVESIKVFSKPKAESNERRKATVEDLQPVEEDDLPF